MTNFEAKGILNITGLSGNSVANIEEDLNVGMSVSSSGGAGVTAVSSDKGTDILSGQLDTLNDIEDVLDKSAISGGGIGGGGGILSTATGGGGIGLTDILGVTSLGTLVSKVSLRSLLSKIPTFAALLGGGILASEFISGDLGREDIIQTPIKVGEIMTGGLVKNDLINGTIGAAAIIGGTVQIGSMVSGVLSGTALGGYLGSVSIGGVLTALGGGSAAAVGGVALAALLGTTAIGTLISDDSTINPGDHVLKMEFGEALVDAGRANVAVVDYITPAPLDEFIAESTDTTNADQTTTTGTSSSPYSDVPDGISADSVNTQRSSDETQAQLEEQGLGNIGRNGTTTWDDRFRRSGNRNRARERQENRQELDINVNGNLTLEEARSAGLIPNGEIPPEARSQILDLVERELLDSRI